MRSIVAVAISALLTGIAASPALADSASRKGEQKRSEDRVVCKTSAKTGTRFTTKTCHTVAQWEKISEENRRALDEMQGPSINTEHGS